MSLTPQEALELMNRALAIRDAERPVPSSVNIRQAAEMLGVSARTVARMKFPRNKAGKIPYRAVVEALVKRPP